MEVQGIFLPLVVVLVVHTLLSTVSRTLANTAVWVMAAAPIVWSLKEFVGLGVSCFASTNIGWTLRHFVGILPAALAVYWLNTITNCGVRKRC